jgi:hypothetical protein
MRKVYEDQDMTMVGYYQSLLEAEGVKTSVKNEYASLATGEIPFTQVYPELWVNDDADYQRSVDLIRTVRASQAEDQERRPVSYKRSARMQLILWPGMLIIILLLVFVVSSIIQALLQ